jgi:hypothetical protein
MSQIVHSGCPTLDTLDGPGLGVPEMEDVNTILDRFDDVVAALTGN